MGSTMKHLSLALCSLIVTLGTEASSTGKLEEHSLLDNMKAALAAIQGDYGQERLKRDIDDLDAEIGAVISPRAPPPAVRRWRVAYAPPAQIPARSDLLPRSGKWILNSVEHFPGSAFNAEYHSPD